MIIESYGIRTISLETDERVTRVFDAGDRTRRQRLISQPLIGGDRIKKKRCGQACTCHSGPPTAPVTRGRQDRGHVINQVRTMFCRVCLPIPRIDNNRTSTESEKLDFCSL